MIEPYLYDDILKLALREDVGTGDITTAATIPAATQIEGRFIAKDDGVVCGLFVAARGFELVDKTIVFTPLMPEGAAVRAGEVMATVSGPARGILTAERTVLNILQRMCAIATGAAKYAAMVKDYTVKLVDTRKTQPGMRILEKYAVRTGGCHNHRINLSDGVLIKDNHIAAAGSIKNAVKLARSQVSFMCKIEVECETMEQVSQALNAGADIIMLDNMSIEQMKAAVEFIAGRATVEASGNMDRRDLAQVAATGVDIISVGALTHSVAAMDISLKFK